MTEPFGIIKKTYAFVCIRLNALKYVLLLFIEVSVFN